jgi:5-methylcytosine-specific restriction endonuclease McrA
MSSYHEESDQDLLFKAERKTYLNRFKFCRICGDFVPRLKRSIDHIIPMWRFTGNYWDRKNWQMLCPVCHTTKTKIESSPDL